MTLKGLGRGAGLLAAIIGAVGAVFFGVVSAFTAAGVNFLGLASLGALIGAKIAAALPFMALLSNPAILAVLVVGGLLLAAIGGIIMWYFSTGGEGPQLQKKVRTQAENSEAAEEREDDDDNSKLPTVLTAVSESEQPVNARPIVGRRRSPSSSSSS